ncbi:tetratricopeptide repeat protein [Candidatus Methylopumilus universalis]|uniref:tetratricopeptide repeat protein n=1 Tax=Candidatus Methylopumilus universalis TaxID=2588536 RepID=UPI003BEEE714
MSKNPSNQIDTMIENAYRAMQLGRYDEVSKIYDRLTINSSDDPTFANIFAQIALQNNLIKEGIVWLKKSLEVFSNQPTALLNLGTAFSEINQHDDALDYFGKSIRLDENNPLAYFNQGVVYRYLNQFDNALNSYKNALKINPDYADALNDIGRIYHLKNEFNLAITYYDKAIQSQPNYSEVIYNKSIALLELKRYDEALVCYDAAIQLKPYDHEPYNGKGNALKELKRYDEALVCYDAAIQLKPDDHKPYNGKGNALKELKRYDEALVCYDAAIQLKPDDHRPYNGKGNALQELKRYDEALVCYDAAIQLKPDDHEPYNGKGNTLQELKRYDEALVCYDAAIQLKPDDHEPYNGKGNTLQELKRYDEALVCYDAAIQFKPGEATGFWNKSLLKLIIGHYEEGWKLYEWRRQMEKNKNNYKLYDQPLWLGKGSLHNKTLLVESEQGFGDVIQFVRYIPMLENIGAKVILEVPKVMTSIIKSLHGNFLVIEKGKLLPNFDYHIPIMSLPLAFNTSINSIPASIPYLYSDKIKREYWNKKLSKKTKPRVGLVWSGSAAHRNDKNRSLLLKDLGPVLQLPFEFHSLQKEVRENEQKTLFEFQQIHQHQNELNDFSDTAALIDEMDLIITVDTSVAHLAGALGKNVWIILPYHPDYRWMLDRNDSPWYPTCTLFRKSKIDDWDDTIEELYLILKKVFQINVEANKTNKHAAVKTDFTRWQNPSNLLQSLDERAIIAARWINSGTNVLDIGCGKMVLEKHLPIGCNYIPCDIVKRDERTNLVDLNDSVIPDTLLKNTDTIVFLGVLEYLFDLDRLFNQLSLSGKTILCSYCGTEKSRKLDRTNLGWVNDLNLKDFERMVSKHNMEIEKFEQIDSVQYLFKIKQKINK